jgi:D-aspartate ligase
MTNAATSARLAGERPPAIILGGGIIAIPAARSLARLGVRVIALGTSTDPAARSFACSEFVVLGEGRGVQDRWLEWLTERPVPGAVLVPCSDDALELTSFHRGELIQLGYRPIEADPEVTLAMLDKQQTYELARKAGVPTPRTVLAQPGDDVSVADGFSYPCGLKPRHSHLYRQRLDTEHKALFAADRQALAAHLARAAELGLDMLVTEIIPGPEDSYHSFYGYLDEHGESLIHVTKRKLRQYPPLFGLATYHMMTREPEVIELGLRFCQGVGLRGIGVVEFKRDARDGTLKLIECNARLTMGTELIHHSGVDLARIAYERALGQRVAPVTDYRVGVRMLRPIEDVRAAVALRREGQLSAREWLTSLRHPQHLAVWSWRDPLPMLYSLLRRMGFGVQSASEPVGTIKRPPRLRFRLSKSL